MITQSGSYRRWFPVTVACLAAGVLAGGCATTRGDAVATADAYAPAPPEPVGFETPPEVAARDFVPADLMSGPHHYVDEVAFNDGYVNHYLVHTDYGDFHAASIEEVRLRVNEIAAIAVLRAMNRREAFGDGVTHGVIRTALVPVRQVHHYLSKPLHLVRVVPGELVRAISIADEVRTLVELGLSEEYAKDLIGYDRAKKTLANRLGVDDDSPNDALQAELQKAAWAFYAGSTPLYLAESYVPPVPIPRLELVEGGGSAQTAIDFYEEELGGQSLWVRLRRLDTGDAQREAFRSNPHYTSRDQRHLVAALYAMKDAQGRDDYIAHAATAGTHAEALRMLRQAQMMATYHEAIAPVDRIVCLKTVALARTADGAAIVPLFGDYIAWTAGLGNDIGRADAWLRATGGSGTREVWITGKATPRTREEFETRGWTVHTDVSDRLEALRESLEKDTSMLAHIPVLRREKVRDTIDRIVDAAYDPPPRLLFRGGRFHMRGYDEDPGSEDTIPPRGE